MAGAAMATAEALPARECSICDRNTSNTLSHRSNAGLHLLPLTKHTHAPLHLAGHHLCKHVRAAVHVDAVLADGDTSTLTIPAA
jgi:hypothetical protein